MRPSERLTLTFLAAMSALASAGLPRTARSLAVFAACAGVTALLARDPPWAPAVVRDFFPVAAIIAVFLVLEPVIAGVNSARWDAVLAAWDERWAAGLVAAWRRAFGRRPAAVDAIYAVYLSYYLVPIGVAALARRRGPEALERVLFTVLLCYWASFAGYLLFPASGPRVPQAQEASLLGGGGLSELVRAFLRFAERTQVDAFPSGHTAISLVSGALAWRVAPRAFPLLAAWIAGVIFSTVYIHVHYAVDVLAGGALAAAVLAGAGTLSRALAPRERPREAL
jgi:membrane-associated phospholipid phosphatase